MAKHRRDDGSRTFRRAVAVAVAFASFVFALVFVRIALEWSDSRPYEGDATEARYIIIMCIAVDIVALGGTVATVLWVRARRR